MTMEVDEASSASSGEESSSTTNSCELHVGSCKSRPLGPKRQIFGPHSQPISHKLKNRGSLHACRKGVATSELNRSSCCKGNPSAASINRRSRAPVRTVNSPQTPLPADVIDETMGVNCLQENATTGAVGDDEEENGSSSEASLSNDPQLQHVLKYVRRTQNHL
uniref:Uncharacterized protein n=1 Tax=Romanomermis culicivorax TaxID=13658 RepID=A0A915HQU2_ROMCU